MSAIPAGRPSGRGWIYLAGGLAVIVAAFTVDRAVTGCFFLPVPDPARKIASGISNCGNWPPILAAGLVLVAGLAALRKYASARLCLLILAAGLLTGLASNLIRATTGRTRPNATAPQGFYGLRYEGKWMAGKYEFGSFPSGHTAAWAGLAGAAWFRRRSLGVAFLAAGVVVGWSRMALGCHHFSDVVAALVWGLAVGPWLANRLENPVNALWSKLGLPPF